jgi:hypothetical protein
MFRDVVLGVRGLLAVALPTRDGACDERQLASKEVG